MVANAETVLCARAMRRKRAHDDEVRRGATPPLRRTRSSLPREREQWRRKTSMTLDLEPFMDDRERKEGLRRLMKWIEESIKSHRRDAETQRTEDIGDPQCDERPLKKCFGLGAEWNLDAESFARVKCDGLSIEALCEKLGISRAKLTRLCREFCNLTALELIDGYKLAGMKNFLVARFKEAARQLWGRPGYFAAFKCEGFIDCEGTRQFHRGDAESQRTAWKIEIELPADETHRRIGELVARVRSDMDLESFALAMGYATVHRLRRACFTVFGHRLEAIERIFAWEIVEYYQAAEDRELRNLALHEPAFAGTYRARELYHKSEDIPAEPFLDRWSAYEFAKPEWLARMGEEFG